MSPTRYTAQDFRDRSLHAIGDPAAITYAMLQQAADTEAALTRVSEVLLLRWAAMPDGEDEAREELSEIIALLRENGLERGR